MIAIRQTPSRVRKTGLPAYSDYQEVPVALSEHGAAFTQAAMPFLSEAVRLKNTWYGKGVVTTKTLEQVAPTTAAASTLWNGESEGGRSYVVNGVGFWCDTTGAVSNILTIYAEPSIVASATVPDTVETAVIRNCRFGAGTYAGSAKISQTVEVTDNGWVPLLTINTAGLIANKGIGGYIPLDGLFVIAPQYYLALHATGTAATMELGFYYVWQEVQLSLQ